MDFEHDILPLKDVIFRTALRVVLNRDEAQDIVQDTLLKLWQKRSELAEVANLQAFAVASARNLALDRKEKMDNNTVSIDTATHDCTAGSVSAPDAGMMKSETHTFIVDTINSLPEKQRMVIQLRDIEEKTYKEIAQILNITESDVKVTLFRARATLREKILQKKSLFL